MKQLIILGGTNERKIHWQTAIDQTNPRSNQ